MPITFPKIAVQFQYNKIADDKLPEGRVSVPITINAVQAGGDVISSIVFAGLQLTGLFYQIDLKTIQGVRPISQIKSISFSAEFANSGAGALPTLYIYVPDSGQLYRLNYQILPDVTGATAYFLTAALPLITNGTILQFLFDVGNAGAESINLAALINNFELAAYTSLPATI